MRLVLHASLFLFLVACATPHTSGNFFPAYEVMRFGQNGGIENLKLNTPIKIRGFIGVHPENRGIFSSRDLAYSKNSVCLDFSSRAVEKFSLKDGEEAWVAGRVRNSECSSDDLICLSACQEYLIEIEDVEVVN